MPLLKPLLFGLIAGLVGALLWALIAYFAHIQLGIIAWVIGGMVGFGVAMGAKGETSAATGMLAAVIALAAIVGGKFLTAAAVVSDAIPSASAATYTDENAEISIAHSLVEESESAGTKLTWPAGKTEDDAESLADFPKPIAAKAVEKWQAMSADDQAAFKKERIAFIRDTVGSIRGTLTISAFKSSFTFLSIVFCFFAVITAFKLGSGAVGES